MSDFLRGEDDEVASFFAFQDVITAVLGILILIALQLSFSINVVHGEEGKEEAPVESPFVSENEFQELVARRKALENELSALRKKNKELRQRRRENEGTGLSRNALLSAIKVLQAEVDLLQTQLNEWRTTLVSREKRLAKEAAKLGLESSQRKIEEMLESLEQMEKENERIEASLEEAQAKAGETNSRLDDEKQQRNSIWLIPEPDLDGKKPLLITVDLKHLRFEEFNAPESLKVLSTRSLTDSLKAGTKDCSPRTHKIVFLFKPSGTKYFQKVIELAKNAGFQVGYDPVEESKEIFFSVPE